MAGALVGDAGQSRDSTGVLLRRTFLGVVVAGTVFLLVFFAASSENGFSGSFLTISSPIRKPPGGRHHTPEPSPLSEPPLPTETPEWPETGGSFQALRRAEAEGLVLFHNCEDALAAREVVLFSVHPGSWRDLSQSEFEHLQRAAVPGNRSVAILWDRSGANISLPSPLPPNTCVVSVPLLRLIQAAVRDAVTWHGWSFQSIYFLSGATTALLRGSWVRIIGPMHRGWVRCAWSHVAALIELPRVSGLS